ncbi:hypothetical protein ABDK00_014420 [Niabella insulamsoli]|uniref:hypothetical protein n=1 Tax=Niabella insulamsoli TaxID=3144874 RepID=UPI0031FD2B2F
MKKDHACLFLLFFVLIATSCQQAAPKKIIEVAVLNTNLVTGFFRPGFFTELMELKEKNSIPVYRDGKTEMNGTAVEYVKATTVDRITESLAKVTALKESEETRPLIRASKDLLEFGKNIFETDYANVAKLIDEEKPRAEIDAAISKIFETHDETMALKTKALDAVAVPYAKKHGIELRIF